MRIQISLLAMILYSIIFLLLSNAVTSRRDKSILYSRETMLISIYSILIIINSLDVTYESKGLSLFSGLFFVNSITQSFHLFMLIVFALILQLTSFYPRKVWHIDYSSFWSIIFYKLSYYNTNITNKMSQQFKIIEYPLILLFIITGGIILMCCGNIVSIFLSIELQSYGLYLLSTIYRNSELSTSAGLTYFLLGGLSSCFILLGSALLYINYGTTSLDGYYIINNISNSVDDYIYNTSKGYRDLFFNISIIIMLVGFLFKISAAPFHFWSPDVYDAIPTIVTTFVAIIAKISILIFLFNIIVYSSNMISYNNFNWKIALLFSSFLSLLVGTILGLVQFRIKRLLAYSTISHLGFILLAISINNLNSIEAFMFYLIQYTISNLNAFIILVVMGYTLYGYTYKNNADDKYKYLADRNNSPIQLVSQLKGYFNICPVLALSFIITLFSFIGIPPILGFFAKQMVLSAALNEGYLFLSIVAILTSVISAVYYLNIVKQMFFDENQYKLHKDFNNTKYEGVISKNSSSYSIINFDYKNITISGFYSISISIITLTMLLFICEPSNLLNAVLLLGLLVTNV